jgi:hypothetical protein
MLNSFDSIANDVSSRLADRVGAEYFEAFGGLNIQDAKAFFRVGGKRLILKQLEYTNSFKTVISSEHPVDFDSAYVSLWLNSTRSRVQDKDVLNKAADHFRNRRIRKVNVH